MGIIFRTKRYLIFASGVRLQEADNKGFYLQALAANGNWINVITYKTEEEAIRKLDELQERVEVNKDEKMVIRL